MSLILWLGACSRSRPLPWQQPSARSWLSPASSPSLLAFGLARARWCAFASALAAPLRGRFGFLLRRGFLRLLLAAAGRCARVDQRNGLVERDRLRRLVVRQRRVDAVVRNVRSVASGLHHDGAAAAGGRRAVCPDRPPRRPRPGLAILSAISATARLSPMVSTSSPVSRFA